MNKEMNVKILLMGKTGVGKSSFINYFIGKEIASTGVGRPVTQETDIYKSEVNGIGIEIYDTKGLEAKISSDMTADLIADISKHNASDDFWNHYHSVFYCVSMGNPRMDAFEIQFLKEIQAHIFQPVNIILTHCDGKDSKKIEEMKVHIRTSLNNIDFPYTITPVCSVREEKRLRTAEPFGKEELEKYLFDQVWQDASTVMANKCVPQYIAAVNTMLNDISNYVDAYFINSFNPKKTVEYCRNIINAVPNDDMIKTYSDRINRILETVKEYKQFIEVYYKVLNKNDVDAMFLQIFEDIKKQMFSKFNYEKLGLQSHLQSKLNSFIGRVKFMISGKKEFCKMMDDYLNEFALEMDERTLKQQLRKDFNYINEKYRKSANASKTLDDALKSLACN